MDTSFRMSIEMDNLTPSSHGQKTNCFFQATRLIMNPGYDMLQSNENFEKSNLGFQKLTA